ncbi:MAG: ABC transporter ATP-binding protein [Actinomycetota bacterium]
MPSSAGTALAAIAPEPGVAKPDPILSVSGLRKSFGGLVAVHVDRLEVQRGTITALIGPNGAGKTTMFNLLTAFDGADAGRWSFDGQPIEGMLAYQVPRTGLVRTFQLTKALSKMTVLDNMTLAATGQRGERLRDCLVRPRWRQQEHEIEGRADALLERFNLGHMRGEYAGTLSGGQRKLLEMARALMVGPRMLLLDEPTAGVNPALVQSILDHVRELRDEGLTVMFVEHDMDVVMGISDWVVCMAEGEVIAEGPPGSIATNDAVIDAYLGARRTEERSAAVLGERDGGAERPEGEEAS